MSKTRHEIDDSELLGLLIESPQLERLAKYGLRLHSLTLEAVNADDSESTSVIAALRQELDASPQRSLQQRASLGDVVAGIAHQSRNIMTGVLSFVQVAAKRNEADGLTGLLEKIEGESRRCVDLLNQVLLLARSRDAAAHRPVQVCSLSTVLASAISLVEPRLKAAHIAYQLTAMPPITEVHGDAQALRDVFVNLLQNAADALGAGGNLEISVAGEESLLRISIEDDGPGVAEEIREKVFASSFTTKGPGRGTGLGLAVSRQVIVEHGGTIAVDRSPLGGARFVIELPCIEEQS